VSENSGERKVKTYPLLNNERTRSFAFEVENAYISPTTISSLLENVEGVTDIQLRKMFSKSSDVHAQFKYLGYPYIVWEPFGDNSRYWIGPEHEPEKAPEIAKLEDALSRYRPPLHRTIIGDLLTLRFITRLIGRGS
jgi:hypothetical protein